MIQKNYIFFLFLALGGVLCHFALCAENSESRLMYLPRGEYIRVISEIISPPPEQTEEGARVDTYDYDNDEDENEGLGDSHRVHFDDVRTERDNQPIQRRRINRNKRDSFFFLQRGMERRSGRMTSINDNSNTA